MQNTKATSNIEVTGRRPAMVPYGLRIPEDEAEILRKTANRLKCKGADLLRTAWSEYIINHNLKG